MTRKAKRPNRTAAGNRRPEQAQQVELARGQWESRRKRNMAIGLLLAAIAIAASVGWSLHSAAEGINQDVASELGPTTAAVSHNAIGNFHTIDTDLKSGKKPKVLMIGAMWCEYCAAERWALVKALGRFGTWSSLAQTTNGSGYPTFDLTKSTYSSWYVAVDHKDVQDVDSNPLQSLDAREKALFNRYDPNGTTPLVIVGKYALVGEGVNPDGLYKRGFRTVQAALIANKVNAYTDSINAEANLITGMLCKADGDNPQVFCDRSTIRKVEARLK